MREPNDDIAAGASDAPLIGRLKRRADFVRVGQGRRWHGKAMTVQAIARGDDDPATRIGYTLTRKTGHAVIRNRARRRLREAVRLAQRRTGGLNALPGHDYVIIGRIDAIRLPFADLTRELDRAIRGATASDARGPRGAKPRGTTKKPRGMPDTPRGTPDKPRGTPERTRPSP